MSFWSSEELVTVRPITYAPFWMPTVHRSSSTGLRVGLAERS
jgi:hypothetical protein